LFYRKSEILPPYNAQICQRIFDGLPFRSVFGRDGLNTIEDRGFCRRYSLQELFTVKLQKRNLVFILPFGIKNFGRLRTAHDQASCTTKRLSACTRNRHHRIGKVLAISLNRERLLASPWFKKLVREEGRTAPLASHRTIGTASSPVN